jgi:hypothetical protein
VWQLLLQNHCSSQVIHQPRLEDVSDGTDSSCQPWDKLLKGFWFLTCIQQQFSTLRYVTWVKYKQDLTCSVLHYSQMPDVQRLCPLCLYYRATMNHKGLYNIMQLSRCSLTIYWRTHQQQLEFLLPNVDIFFWKWVSYPSGHNRALRTSNWKCNNTKHSNTKLHGPIKLKSEPKKAWPSIFLLSLQTNLPITPVCNILIPSTSWPGSWFQPHSALPLPKMVHTPNWDCPSPLVCENISKTTQLFQTLALIVNAVQDFTGFGSSHIAF